jgi:hypothetical protein
MGMSVGSFKDYVTELNESYNVFIKKGENLYELIDKNIF